MTNSLCLAMICSVCEKSERIAIEPEDVVYFQDILKELGWVFDPDQNAWICPECMKEENNAS